MRSWPTAVIAVPLALSSLGITASERSVDDEDPVTEAKYGLLEEMTQPETYPQTVLLVLEGKGAYEGLSLRHHGRIGGRHPADSARRTLDWIRP